MTAYATRRDVYRYGLARGTVGTAPRLVASSSASTDTLELDEHGFETDDELILRATEGGTLSAPLVEGTSYYAIRENASTFQLAATPGGSPINLTTDGVSMLVSIALPFDEVLEFFSRHVDTFFPGHVVPFTAPIPLVVVALVASLAAQRLQLLAGVSSETTAALVTGARLDLERFAKGLPLRDTAATAPANLAITASLSGGADPRGWGSGQLP